jgi:hypothetical protein
MRPAEHYITDDKGRKVSVILSYRRYKRLLEDLHDLAVIAERKDEPTVSFAEFKRQLKQDGKL